ncbi:MAG TPA: DUF3147 family protein [Acidimicrobiales bacterium]|nr:DUF3147 family protein [Acidimicrobiales bacterium]
MGTVVSVALRGLIAAVLVVAFSILGDTLEPKKFAGIFSGAPSVALASLAVVALMKGPRDVSDSLVGMVFGGVAFVVAACVGIVGYQRLRSLPNSVLIWLVWAVAAGAGALVVR